MSINFTPLRQVQDQWHHFPEIKSVNVSNANAADILANLGIDPMLWDRPPLNLEEFEAECATFLRLASGTEADGAKEDRVSGNWVDCGRRPGYLTSRVTQLLELARVALKAGATHLAIG